MPFVSVTRLRIRSLRFLPSFLLQTWRTRRQVRRSSGFITGALLADRRRTFWTVTIWQDEPAMRQYMVSGAHRLAMPQLLDWCDEASVVHWVQPSVALPSWHEADRRMRAEGRPSKVRHPAPTHLTLTYEAPRTSRMVPLTPASDAR